MTTLECVPTHILGFLEQAMKQHFLPARAKNITFELVPSTITRNVAIDVDPIKLITVFRNLFSNAIKFTKKQGRVTVRVEVKTIKDIEVVEVTVQDTGAGLSAANLRKLFGEGVQFNANGLQGGGGSGLGLFITKGPWSLVIHRLSILSFSPQLFTLSSFYKCTITFMNPTGIVDLHKNGKIWAESEGEGFGCTFFVQLPLHSHHYVVTPHEGDSVGHSVGPSTPVHGSVALPINTSPYQLPYQHPLSTPPINTSPYQHIPLSTYPINVPSPTNVLY